MVLLNDNNHALPLSTGTSSIAVVGPLADDPLDQLGPDVPIGYDTTPADLKTKDQIVSVLDGIKAAAPNAHGQLRAGLHVHADGHAATRPAGSGRPWPPRSPRPSPWWSSVSRRPTRARRRRAATSTCRSEQDALIQAIAHTGKPYVVVLMNGRPLTIPELSNAPALLEAWYPGTTGGTAVANVLFGKFDPSGKLTMSFPVNVGQIPISYNELPTGRPYSATNKYTSKYLDVAEHAAVSVRLRAVVHDVLDVEPASAPAIVARNGTMRVTADITNTGSVAGADVVQLYVHESDTSILQPVRKLEGFQRVTLDPGSDADGHVHARTAEPRLLRRAGDFVVEPGPFDLWVGDSSDGGIHTTFTLQ